MLATLTTLTLGKNPLKQSASPSALEALVKTQGSGLRLLSPPQHQKKTTGRHQGWSDSVSKSSPPTPRAPPPPSAGPQPHPLHPAEDTVGAVVITESRGAPRGGDISSRGGTSRGVSNGVGHGIADEEMAINAAGGDRKKGACNDSIDSARYSSGEKVPGFGSAALVVGHRGRRSGGDAGGEEEKDVKKLAAGASGGSGGLDSPAIETALDYPLRRSASETAADPLIGSGGATPQTREQKPGLLAPSVLGVVALDPSPGESLDSLEAAPAGSKRATRSAEAAFERLAEARERAAGSSWGGVALAGSGSDKEEVGNAWSASALAAKLLCNGMVSLLSPFSCPQLLLYRPQGECIGRIMQGPADGGLISDKRWIACEHRNVGLHRCLTFESSDGQRMLPPPPSVLRAANVWTPRTRRYLALTQNA